MKWMEYALQKAGVSSREAFCRHYGLPVDSSGLLQSWQALWSLLAGFTYHRLTPGETLYQVALQYGTSIRAILTANEFLRGGPLQPGQTLVIPLAQDVVSCRLPMNAPVQELYLQGLLARYPQLSAWSLARTAAGHCIWALRIGRGRRKVLLTAAHHANEWITGTMVWLFVEHYLNAIRDNGFLYGQSCRELFEQTSLYLVPLVNPDGADLVTGELDPRSPLYQKALDLAASQPQVPFPAGWKANLHGVDLNLNYPARFEAACTEPGPGDYPGAEPLDQPETRALALLTRKLRPDAVCDWHTQGAAIYARHPDGSFPDEALARRLAEASGYTLRQMPPEAAGGTYRDWVLQEYGVPAFTVEAGCGQNPLPLSDLEQLYEANLPIFVLLLRG